MDISLSARFAIVGFCVLLGGGLFLYHYLEDRARRKKASTDPSRSGGKPD